MLKCIFLRSYSSLLLSTSPPLQEIVQLAPGNDPIYCKYRKLVLMDNASEDSLERLLPLPVYASDI